MNYYKMTETLISNYRQLKTFIEIKKMEVEEIDYYSLPGINLEYTGGPSGTGSTTENAAIRIHDRKKSLEKQIDKTTRKVERIEMAMSTLDQTGHEILTARYIERKEWWQIAYQIHCGERWAKELRRRAILTMAVALYGEEAMKESTNTAHLTEKPVL